MFQKMIKLSRLVSCGIDLDMKGGALTFCRGPEILYSVFVPGQKQGSDTERIHNLTERILGVFKNFDEKYDKVQVVAIEKEPFSFAGKKKEAQSRGYHKKARLTGVMLDKLYDRGYLLAEYPSTSIKMYAGKGNCGKPELIELVNELWGHRFFDVKGKPSDDLTVAFVISQFVINHFGIEFLRRKMKGTTPKQELAVNNILITSAFYSKQEFII